MVSRRNLYASIYNHQKVQQEFRKHNFDGNAPISFTNSKKRNQNKNI